MDEVLYQSKNQMKRIERMAEKESFLKEKKETEILKRWEEAQVTAASAQSVLDYMVQHFEEHKAELSEDIIAQTEEQIVLRKKDIEDFIMSEKELYLESIGIQAD